MTRVCFAELVEFTLGGGWGSDTPAEGLLPVRVIRGADFPDAQLQTVSTLPLRFEDKKSVARRELRVGDLVLEISGGTKDRPTGRTVLVTDSMLNSTDAPLIPASFCRLVRPDRARTEPRWLYYLLQDWWNRGGSWEFQNRSTGISNFQYPLFAQTFSIPLPEISEQRSIGEVLGALDDKITANQRVVTAADALLVSQFRIGARTLGRTPVRELAQVVLGGTPARDNHAYWGGDVPWINSGACNERFVMQPTERITPDGLAASAAKMMPPGTTVIAITGATLGQMGWLGREMSANQSVVGVTAGQPTRSWIYYALRSEKEQLLQWATGGAQQHVNKGAVSSIEIPWDPRVATHFGRIADLLLSAVAARLDENGRLATTRDELLPLLVSGRITVKDAERRVEDEV